jgi:hypothetical protein
LPGVEQFEGELTKSYLFIITNSTDDPDRANLAIALAAEMPSREAIVL